MICLALFAAGIGISYIHINNNNSGTYSGIVVDAHDNYFIMLSKGEKLYTYQKENEYEIGDYLTVKGRREELDFVTIESQFDFGDYLNKKGVTHQIKNAKVETKFSNPLKIRSARKKFLSHFSEKEQALIKALLFSERGDSDEIDAMSELHLMRLASASGIFIYAYLNLLTMLINKIRKKEKQTIIPLLILIPYFVMTFPRFTVMRILILEIMRYINNRFLKNSFTSYSLLAFSGFLFLLFDYHLGYQMSFIMGYTIPAAASLISDGSFRYKGIRKKLIQSAFIYIFIIPFELKFYNGINPLSPILIILLSPIFILNAIMSLLCLYGLPIYSPISWMVNGISKVLSFLLKYSIQINAPPMKGLVEVLFALIFIVFLYYRSIEFKPLKKIALATLASFLTIYFLPIENLLTTEVCFINVGQGDSCLIKKGEHAVLIDTGGLKNVDVAKESLIPFLKRKRIYNIDLVIATHNDYDHIGAYDSLNENFYVKNLVTESASFPVSVNGITFVNYNNHITKYSEENEKSLVVGFTLSNKHYLIMGDATIKVEKQIIEEYQNIPCDILKVGHHGSNTSTSDEFIKFIKPKEAVISCGVNNQYGHPKSSVLQILENNSVVIRRTDLEGTITYKHYIFM